MSPPHDDDREGVFVNDEGGLSYFVICAVTVQTTKTTTALSRSPFRPRGPHTMTIISRCIKNPPLAEGRIAITLSDMV